MIESSLHAALSGAFTPKFLATLDAQGRPNCVPVISITPFDETTLIFGEFLMNKTRANLDARPEVCVAVQNDAFESWSVRGRFDGWETQGPRIDAINRSPMFRYNAYTSVRAAGIIRIEDASGKQCLPKASMFVRYLYARALAGLRRVPAREESIMPLRVQEKFRRLTAVCAVAFQDAEGWPRAFAAMPCIAAGPRRLLLADPRADQWLKDLPSGAEMAVAIITMDAVAYQVKGVYRETRAGLHVVHLDACYSASPPLAGDRLDRGNG